jgi:hypothetical protein
MAYFISLKYWRSLKEFRKNPHVKIPPKSSCVNFQSLGIFKNLIFIQKGIFFGFRPSPAPRWPTPPHKPPAPRSAHLAQAALAYFLKGIFSLTLRTPVETPSLSHHHHVGPACQLHPLRHAGRPLPFLLIISGHPAPPSFTLGCRPSHYSPRHHSPPLNPPLNLAPVFHGVKAINAPVTPPPRPPLYGAPPAPIKGR